MRIVGLSRDRSKTELTEKIKAKNWRNVLHLFVGGRKHPSLKNYKVASIPKVVLVDKKGKIVYMGHPMKCNLEKKIQNLLDGNFEIKSQEVLDEIGKSTLKLFSKNLRSRTNEFFRSLAYNPSFKATMIKTLVFETEDITLVNKFVTKPLLNIDIKVGDVAKMKSLIEDLNSEFGENLFCSTINSESISVCSHCEGIMCAKTPQFFCFTCKIHFCEACADKGHPHTLLFARVNNANSFNEFEEGELEKILPQMFNMLEKGCNCNSCGNRLLESPVFICLSCRHKPGTVSLCNICMNLWKKCPSESQESQTLSIKLSESEKHDQYNHVFLRISYWK